MSVRNSIKSVPFVSIASTALSGTYQPINPLGLPEACFLLRITNFGTTVVTISFDGTNAADQVPIGGVLEVYGGEGSSSPNTNHCLWAKGTIVSALGSAGASGNIGVAGYYQPQGV